MYIKECTKCLLSDADTKQITFNDDGICSYCQFFDQQVASLPADKTLFLNKKVDEIKAKGKNQKYDCLLGLSGGLDSSYMAFLAKQLGLRPLVIHLDNGWNSDIAVKNIEKICDKLDFELYTYVIDWDEFMTLQKAYLRAGVIDIEVLTDHAIYAILYKLANKFNIKYTLNGYNYETEAIMPKGWTYNKRDFSNIKDIAAQYAKNFKFKTFPSIDFYKSLYYFWFVKLESFYMLNYVDYDKSKAKEFLIKEVDWTDYGGKHFESVFTKFYQSYILPIKFGIDKRKAHYSNLICAGKMTKPEAQEIISQALYKDSELAEDKEYILKKLKMDEAEFDNLMKQPPKSHNDFKTDQPLWNKYFKLIKLLKFGK